MTMSKKKPEAKPKGPDCFGEYSAQSPTCADCEDNDYCAEYTETIDRRPYRLDSRLVDRTDECSEEQEGNDDGSRKTDDAGGSGQ